MKIVSIILLVLCAVCLVTSEFAIAAFCGVVGLGLLPLSSSSKKEDKAPARNPRQPARKAPKPAPKPDIQVPGAPAVDAYAYGGSQKDYFYYLLSRAFPAYAVQVDVRVSDLTGNSFSTMQTISEFDIASTMDESSVPVTFLLCRDGAPKLAILLGGRDDRNTDPYRATEEKLVSMGIPVQYYINTFRNKASYVYTRVSEALN